MFKASNKESHIMIKYLFIHCFKCFE